MLKFLANRAFTNVIHFILDELIPPFLRDTKWFMYPFFYLAYKGKDVKKYIEFKANYYSMDNATLRRLYKNYDTVGTDRKTDLNKKSLAFILKNLDNNSLSLLDIGCGRGYFLEVIKNQFIFITGVDLFKHVNIKSNNYVIANIDSLPFKSNSFDVVVANHILEHVIAIKQAVAEIKRVAAKQIVITVPRQRSYYYTLDLHLHFFLKKEMLINLLALDNYTCEKKGGDWVFVGYV